MRFLFYVLWLFVITKCILTIHLNTTFQWRTLCSLFSDRILFVQRVLQDQLLILITESSFTRPEGQTSLTYSSLYALRLSTHILLSFLVLFECLIEAWPIFQLLI